MQNGKYNKKTGVGEAFKLYEQKVYEVTPDNFGYFYDEKENVIAQRMLLPLTVDSVFGTQFRNEKLRYAVKPLNEATKLIFYANGTKLNEYAFLPELSQEYASIICKVAPEIKPTHVSVVIYTGQSVDKVFLTDGSTTMDPGYTPTKPSDVVTKAYADDLIEDFTALGFPLRDLSITQNGRPPLKGFCYLDNAEYDVLLYRDFYTTASCEDCVLKVEPFAIANNYNKNTTRLALVVNQRTSHIAYVKDIINGNGDFWRLVSHTDIYTSSVDEFFWKNGYELTFNLSRLQYSFTPENPFIDLAVKLYDDDGNVKMSSTLRVGLDERISHAEPEVSLEYVKETLDSYKTKWISGIAYFPHNFETVYDLPITLNVENKWLRFFRPAKSATIEILNAEQKATQFVYTLSPTTHIPTTGTFDFRQPVQFQVDARFLRFRSYNLEGDVVFEKVIALDIDSDFSDESNRVYTTDASQLSPNRDFGDPWDSTKKLEDWEPKLYHGKYTCNEIEKSAVCFAIDADDCYSHALIDIEHDGEMYVFSRGNTGWLNCQEIAKPFTIPKQHNDPCKMNEGFYTFGKVVYNSRVYVRIIKASHIKFNSVKLC